MVAGSTVARVQRPRLTRTGWLCVGSAGSSGHIASGKGVRGQPHLGPILIRHPTGGTGVGHWGAATAPHPVFPPQIS